jgi:GT2 family glycosyltransferase
MTIYFPIPYRIDKNLAKAYNDEFFKVKDDDYVCLRDYDTLFLLPETIADIYGYVERYPHIDLFTCYGNRNHWSLKEQILNGEVSNNTDISHHIDLAIKQREQLYKITAMTGHLSGFFILMSKRLWKEMQFREDRKCLGVDTQFSLRLRSKGKTVYRMDGVYLFHIYRLHKGVHDRSHLA